MENNARQIRLDREASRLEEAKREAQSLFDQVAIEILSNKSKTTEQRLAEIDAFKSQAEANVPGLTLQYPDAYLVLKSRVSRPVSTPVAPATPITPTATVIPAAAVTAAPASPLTNSLGTRDIPAEAADAVRTNFELQAKNERVRLAAKAVGVSALALGVGVAGVKAANWVHGLDWSSKTNNNTAVAPAQPGSTASSVQPVNPSAPVLTVPAAPAAQPAPQPAATPAAPQMQNDMLLDNYDKLFGVIQNKIIAWPTIKDLFPKQLDVMMEGEMQQYQTSISKKYPGTIIKGTTYAYRGTRSECIDFVKNLKSEMDKKGYKIDSRVTSFIPCIDGNALVGVYTISNNPDNIDPSLPADGRLPSVAPAVKAAAAVAPVIAQVSNPSPSVVQAAPTIQTNSPAQAIAAPIDDYNKLWNAINSAVNSEGSPLPKGKTFRLTDSQTNQLRQGLNSITGKVFTMGVNNYGYMMMQGEDLSSCKAFAENAMKVFSGKLGGKVEDYAFIPCYGADKNLVAIYTLSNPIKEYKFTNNAPQQTSRNTGWQTQGNYKNQSEYNAVQNARGFYNWGNETEAKRLAAVERANDIRNGTVMPRFVMSSN